MRLFHASWWLHYLCSPVGVSNDLLMAPLVNIAVTSLKTQTLTSFFYVYESSWMSTSNHVVFVAVKYFFIYLFFPDEPSFSPQSEAALALRQQVEPHLCRIKTDFSRSVQPAGETGRIFTQSCDWHRSVAQICHLGMRVAPLCLEILWNGSTMQTHSAMFVQWPKNSGFPLPAAAAVPHCSPQLRRVSSVLKVKRLSSPLRSVRPVN